MGSSVLKFADVQESLIQVLKSSNVGSTIMKGLRFADSQESLLQASKRSNMGSDLLVGCRSTDIQEFGFQAANLLIWNVPNCKGFYLLIVKNGILDFEKFR